ncbi:hypothetical protein SMJ63A_60235 [Stenotrophomonas geniculata]
MYYTHGTPCMFFRRPCRASLGSL